LAVSWEVFTIAVMNITTVIVIIMILCTTSIVATVSTVTS